MVIFHHGDAAEGKGEEEKGGAIHQGISHGIRANLSPSMVWFDDELDGSWWTCNTLNESHHNEKGLKVVQV